MYYANIIFINDIISNSKFNLICAICIIIIFIKNSKSSKISYWRKKVPVGFYISSSIWSPCDVREWPIGA